MQQPAVAAGVLISEALSFGDTAERLLEVLLVVLVGISLVQSWAPLAVALAGILFFVIRPLASVVILKGTRTTRGQRRLIGWFGIRGIGSLYYLTYALNHGATGQYGDTLVHIVITVVACSIVLHGVSVTPVLDRYENALRRHSRPA